MKNRLINNKNKYVERYNLNELIFSYDSKKDLNKKYHEIKKDIDLKGFSSSMTLSNKLQEEFKIRQKYENIFMLFLKIFLKMFSYFFTKIFLRDKYLKYN